MKLERPYVDRPDFEHFRRVMMGESREGRVPFIELVVDIEIMNEVTGENFPADRLLEVANMGLTPPPEAMELGIRYLNLTADFCRAVGYDYATTFPILPIPIMPNRLRENPQQGNKKRAWQNEHGGLIMTRADFEAFAWPSREQVSAIPVLITAQRMAPGQKALAFVAGIFEMLKGLMGFEVMAIKSIEEPDLLDDILERTCELTALVTDLTAANPDTGAVFYAEDMGFNTQTMLSPKWMREHVIPRLARIASAAHRHGKPFLLHSCGQIDALMEDLIEKVKIDGRHSFQDNLEPVEKVYQKYGHRIAVLGGVDVDLLARGTTDQVRKRTRQILESCHRGRFCVGSGNSVTNFCRLENYYAMLDETRNFNEGK